MMMRTAIFMVLMLSFAALVVEAYGVSKSQSAPHLAVGAGLVGEE
ncbi:unnamed protein product [Tenebrio molitor]|nr:unnamed protein product [Tenebrio molitor]